MRLISTQKTKARATFLEAIQQALGSGPYAMEPVACFRDVPALLEMPFHERTLLILQRLLGEELSTQDLEGPVSDAFREAPLLRKLRNRLYFLELFHGPTASMKDYGARFLANLWEQASTSPRTLLVAGDDAGIALAHAFDAKKQCRVMIVSPREGMPTLHEILLASLENAVIFELPGAISDCRALVDECHADATLCQSIGLLNTSPTNMAWTLAEIPLFFEAVSELRTMDIREAPLLSIPCPGFGTLYSALAAKEMGLPIKACIAAMDIQDLDDPGEEGLAQWAAQSPNGPQLLHAFKNNAEALCKGVRWAAINNQETGQTLWELSNEGCIPSPDAALALHCMEERRGLSETGIFCTPTHPSSCQEMLEKRMNLKVGLPPSLLDSLGKTLKRHEIPDKDQFKKTLPTYI